MKKPKLVEVTWVDSAMTPGWKRAGTVVEPSECRTTGYLTYKNKEVLNIAMQVNDDGGFGEAMAIPIVCVRKIRKLR